MAHKPFPVWDGFEYRDIQDERGVDLELIRANLELSVEQRIEQHRRAAASILWLKNATLKRRPSGAR